MARCLENAIEEENNQANLYNMDRDYQHLMVCRYGHVSKKYRSNDVKIEINTNNPRVTAQEKPPADTCMLRGRKSSEAMRCANSKTEGSGKLTYEVDQEEGVVAEAKEEATKGTAEGTKDPEAEADGEASAEARKLHNHNDATNKPKKERASNIANNNIANNFYFKKIEPHGSGGVLENNKKSNSNNSNYLTNKKGINSKKVNENKSNKTKDKEPSDKTNKGKGLITNREELTQGNTGNWRTNSPQVGPPADPPVPITNRDETIQGNTGNWLNNGENKNTKTSGG